MTISASIVGASGYGGGELLRLLLSHPQVEVKQITSRQNAGKFALSVHPNLRGRTKLKFTTPDQLEKCDVLFLGLPHSKSAADIEKYASIAERIVDLSADFRLRDAAAYEKWYEWTHPAAGWLERFVYGLPETNREAIRGAKYVSGVGCNATACNLALLPLARKGLIESVVVDLKVGSSEGGAESSPATHHPIRSGALRTFAPTGHRHQAEVAQELGAFPLHFTATAVEMIRGVLCTAHVFLKETMDDKALWPIFREQYGEEPFVRVIKEKTGFYRLPEPKLVAGTNYADVGFVADEGSNRVVVISAIDNLMKGAAGTAVQCMNLMHGFDETTALDFAGLHPIG
ncbi:MAG: N-acetyl-gamma-glutamyl-phosphate reductase [Planctomycetota bacterium]|nr:N-acetyl-gamma-glutamyl-phosphate reductase [Planctomycetota bacterium]